jgi:curli production assembly/transport component CsgF
MFNINTRVNLRACALALSVFPTFLATSAPASASDIVYRPVDPSFGGNPMNSSHLLAVANAQNDYKPPVVSAPGGSVSAQTPAQAQAAQFLTQLQSRLISALAAQVTDAIFGNDPQNSGQVTFGTQTVSFQRGLSDISITLTDSSNNSSTNISVPIFITGN